MMHAGLRARKLALCPPLTVEHRNRRLQFAKGRVNWNHQSYPRIALEWWIQMLSGFQWWTKVCMEQEKRAIQAYRKTNERFKAFCTWPILWCVRLGLGRHKLRWFHRPLCHKERISYRCLLHEWDHCTYCKTRSWRHWRFHFDGLQCQTSTVQERSTSIWKRKQTRRWIGRQKHLILIQRACMGHHPETKTNLR